MNPKSLTVFFPACNDGGTIGSQVITALQLLPRITDDYEVLVVNDGSRDHTADVLAELSRQYPQVRVIHHATNRGYGAALRSGFAAARKEWVFYTDGDAQYDPHDLVRLLAVWNENVDVVTGYKIARNDPFYRVLLGRLYHYVVLFGYWIVLLLGGKPMLAAYPLAIILSGSMLVWLIVGSYINFIFVPQNKYYFVTRNQFVAFISFVVLCVLGVLIFHNIAAVVVALTLSGYCEIVYCNYLIKKHKLL